MANELAAALASVQADLPRIAKNKTAKVEHKAGGSHSYKYADLADVSDAILPRLAEHGLAWTCAPLLREDGQFVLRYSLTQVSGEKLTGDYPLERGGAQQVGGWITYARRYALGAVTGVATEEDTDGRSEPQPRQQRQPKPRAEANGSGQPDRVKGLITSIQMRYQELGFKRTERDDMLRASEQIIGHALTGPHEGRTHNNLSEPDARKLRDTLGGFKDRGDLLAALVEAATP